MQHTRNTHCSKNTFLHLQKINGTDMPDTIDPQKLFDLLQSPKPISVADLRQKAATDLVTDDLAKALNELLETSTPGPAKQAAERALENYNLHRKQNPSTVARFIGTGGF
jgi:hypothetical protein